MPFSFLFAMIRWHQGGNSMKTYKNDDEMIEELYSIMRYIQTQHRTNDETVEASYSLENAIVEIRESLDI